MENTKAVAVADDICRNAIKDWGDTGKLLVSRGVMADLIQSAIDEATADLRAQLADAQAQLAAERAALDMAVKYIESLIRLEQPQFDMPPEPADQQSYEADETLRAIAATRQPTQDKGE